MPDRTPLLVAALALVAAAPAAAQVVVDGSGVRAGGMVVDSHGVHGPGVEVDDRGVRTGYGSGRRRPGGAGVTVLRNGVTGRMDCGGGAAQVVGNRNRLTLEGCGRVEVSGNGNDLEVSLVRPAEIVVTGNGDRVSYRAPPGVRPHITAVGHGAVVERRP